MTTTRELLVRYNDAAVKLGKPELKNWKGSTTALQVRTNDIERQLNKAMDEAADQKAFEATQQELDQQATRQDIHAASNELIAKAVANDPELAAIVKAPSLAKASRMLGEALTPKAKKSTKKTPAPAPAAKAGFSAAAIIAEFGINAKVGRALMRKHNVAKNAAAVRKFFSSRKK